MTHNSSILLILKTFNICLICDLTFYATVSTFKASKPQIIVKNSKNSL